jgi:hypothetical protein
MARHGRESTMVKERRAKWFMRTLLKEGQNGS